MVILSTTSIQAELNQLGISQEKISQLISIYGSYSSDRWEYLFNILKNTPPQDRDQLVGYVIEGAGDSTAANSESVSGSLSLKDRIKRLTQSRSKIREEKTNPHVISWSKMEKIQQLSQTTLAKMNKLECLVDKPELRKISDEWDSQLGCTGDPIYVCHHCHHNVCSTHSYWIPDHEVPYLIRVDKRMPEKPPEDKRPQFKKLAIIFFALAALSLLIMIEPYFIGISLFFAFVFIFAGVIFLIKMKKFKLDFAPNVYPEYTRTMNSKWGNIVEISYEHRGFYTAVHCWDCLQRHHPEFIEAGKEIYTNIWSRSTSWGKTLLDGTFVQMTEQQRIDCANFGANLFLSDYKFAEYCYLPFNNTYRLLIRPPAYHVSTSMGGRHFMPTPVWLMAPIQGKAIPQMRLVEWINQYEGLIRSRAN